MTNKNKTNEKNKYSFYGYVVSLFRIGWSSAVCHYCLHSGPGLMEELPSRTLAEGKEKVLRYLTIGN